MARTSNLISDGIELFRQQRELDLLARAGCPTDATWFGADDGHYDRHVIICRIAPNAPVVLYGNVNDRVVLAKHPCGWFSWKDHDGASTAT